MTKENSRFYKQCSQTATTLGNFRNREDIKLNENYECFEIKKQDAFQHEEGVFKISQSEGVLISIHLTNLQFDTLENLHRHFYHTCFVPTT